MRWIEQELEKRAAEVNQALDEFLPAEDVYPSSIHQAMRYSVMAGGKRLRPILVMAAAEVVGGDPRNAQPIAVAIEFIHTYSLIHDDLPAMDNDDFRRGKPTCHKVWGEALAILAGDALLTHAFEVLTHGMELKNGSTAEIIIQIQRELTAAAGTRGMIAGQVLDLASEGKQINADTLKIIHKYKTGALIRAAVRAGALLANATSDEMNDLTQYAEEFGLAFQIMDDILDVVGDESKLGKSVGSDARNAKATFPYFFGLERSRIMAQESIERAVTCLGRFGDKGRFLRDLAYYVIERES